MNMNNHCCSYYNICIHIFLKNDMLVFLENHGNLFCNFNWELYICKIQIFDRFINSFICNFSQKLIFRFSLRLITIFDRFINSFNSWPFNVFVFKKGEEYIFEIHYKLLNSTKFPHFSILSYCMLQLK